MESIISILPIIAGFAIRLVIPIAITALGIYLLRRLDERWQIEAAETASMPVVEKPKCWETNKCSPEDRKNCPGFQSEQPCWQAFRKDNGYLQDQCLGCEVFLNAPAPVHS